MTATQNIIFQNTVATLAKLPPKKIEEVSNFADFILKKYEEEMLQKGIQHLVNTSETFAFLEKEEDSYTLEDLKIRFK